MPSNITRKDIVVVPAYEPDERLTRFALDLHTSGYALIVVDDGSSAACLPIWNALPENTVLLHHRENRGKGAALKTAFRYLLESDVPVRTIITADADGQHLPENVDTVCVQAQSHPDALVLGVRQFDRQTPLRSRIGNRVTAALFRALCRSRKPLHDTQTGLRAFSGRLLPEMLDIPGDRYEYEMNVLLACEQQHIPLEQVPIHTVYADAQNSTSHFDTLRDSLRIIKTILKFSASSLIGFATDYVAFLALVRLLAPLPFGILCSNIAARFISATVNYQTNRLFVFGGKQSAAQTLPQYIALAAGILAANSALLTLGVDVLGLPAAAAKLMTEVLLFLISLCVQSLVIFRPENDHAAHP